MAALVMQTAQYSLTENAIAKRERPNADDSFERSTPQTRRNPPSRITDALLSFVSHI